jgi:hypothetical protein
MHEVLNFSIEEKSPTEKKEGFKRQTFNAGLNTFI